MNERTATLYDNQPSRALETLAPNLPDAPQ
jgi:hypothetical protein